MGKTTLTYHLSTGLTHLDGANEYNPRILLIDLDPQCSLSISCLHEDRFENLIFNQQIRTIKELFSAYFMSDTPHINPNDYILSNCVRKDNHQNQLHYYDNIDLIVSHPDLIYSDMDISQLSRPSFQESLLTRDLYKFKFLYNFLKSVKDNYDYIFIDCPPNLNFITQNSIYASNFYLVPTKLDKLSTYGILSITHKVNDLNLTFGQIDSDYTSTHLLGIIPNNVKEHNGGPISSQNNRLVYLRDTFINSTFTTYLTEGDGIPSASNNSFPVYSLNTPNAQKQSTALLNIAYELVDKILNY